MLAAAAPSEQDAFEDGDLSNLLGRDLKDAETSSRSTEATLAALEAALRPIEKYAVSWLEQASSSVVGEQISRSSCFCNTTMPRGSDTQV